MTALLVKAAGRDPYFFHGKASFIAKRRGSLPELVIEQSPHSWVGIEEVGSVDLSIKPVAVVDGEQLRLPMTHVFANRVWPDAKIGFAFVRDEATYRRVLDGARAANKSAAIYLLSRGESLVPEILPRSAAWINSPLTDWLRSRYADPSTAYCALALHLIALLAGQNPSLSGVGREEAWDRVVAGAARAPEVLKSTLAIQ